MIKYSYKSTFLYYIHANRLKNYRIVQLRNNFSSNNLLVTNDLKNLSISSKKSIIATSIANIEMFLEDNIDSNVNDVIDQLQILHYVGITIPLDYYTKISFILSKRSDFYRLDELIKLAYNNLKKSTKKESKSLKSNNIFDKLILYIESHLVKHNNSFESFEQWKKINSFGYNNRRDSLEKSITRLNTQNIKIFDIVSNVHHSMKQNVWNYNNKYYINIIIALTSFLSLNKYCKIDRYMSCLDFIQMIINEIIQLEKTTNQLIKISNSFLTNDLKSNLILLYIACYEQSINFDIDDNYKKIIQSFKLLIDKYFNEIINEFHDNIEYNICHIFYKCYDIKLSNESIDIKFNISDVSNKAIIDYICFTSKYYSYDKAFELLRYVISTFKHKYNGITNESVNNFFTSLYYNVLDSYSNHLINSDNKLNVNKLRWFNIIILQNEIFNESDKIINSYKDINIYPNVHYHKKLLNILIDLENYYGNNKNYNIKSILKNSLNNIKCLPINKWNDSLIYHSYIYLLCNNKKSYHIMKCIDVIQKNQLDNILPETLDVIIYSAIYNLNRDNFIILFESFKQIIQFKTLDIVYKKSNIISIFYCYCRLNDAFKVIQIFNYFRSNSISIDRNMYIWMILSIYHFKPIDSNDMGLVTNPKEIITWLIKFMNEDNITIDSTVLSIILKLYNKAIKYSIKNNDDIDLLLLDMFDFINVICENNNQLLDELVINQIVKACCLIGKHEQLTTAIKEIENRFNISLISYTYEYLLNYHALITKDVKEFKNIFNDIISNKLAIIPSYINSYIILYNNDFNNSYNEFYNIYNNYQILPSIEILLYLLYESLNHDHSKSKYILSILKEFYLPNQLLNYFQKYIKLKSKYKEFCNINNFNINFPFDQLDQYESEESMKMNVCNEFYYIVDEMEISFHEDYFINDIITLQNKNLLTNLTDKSLDSMTFNDDDLYNYLT